jgi:hypothetical protein
MREHPLLFPYGSPYELYFKGSPGDPVAVIGELYTRHVAAFGHWFRLTDSSVAMPQRF